MQITKFLNMNKEQLQEEIEKTEAKMKNLKTQVSLLRRLQESAKGNTQDSHKVNSAESGNYRNEG